MQRYVILFHQMPSGQPRPAHWDVMLERGETLRTWALAQMPEAGRAIAAEALPDHRLAYLTYEGPVSGDRGHVTRWDGGEITRLVETPDGVTAEVRGERLQGEIQLHRLDLDSGSWTFHFVPRPS